MLGCSMSTQAFGEAGEALAARWLGERGWVVLARRFRSGHRDLDLVARRGELVAFIEVKARHGREFGDPVEAVGWRKQRELIRSAHVWVDRHGVAGDTYRFDVIGVLVEGERVRIRHVEGAFAAPWAT